MFVLSEAAQGSIAKADALRDAGQLDEALAAYQAIAADFPESHEARYKLATCFAKLKKTAEAERGYREAISLWNEHPEANNNLGTILSARGELDEAERLYRVALAERTDYFQAHLNLSRLLNETRRLLEAKYHADRALTISPRSPDAHVQLGQVLLSLGKISSALIQFERAAELDPHSALALSSLGFLYWQIGRHADAEKMLRSALTVLPDFLPAWNNLLMISNYRLLDREQVFRLHRAFNDIVRRQCGEVPAPPAEARPDGHRRLRIGFISGDLRRNSVAYFIRAAVEHLDRGQFQLFAYYNYRTEDEVTWTLKRSFQDWRSIYGVTDEDVAALIQKDRIDILVDLAGHTAGNRPLVLGRRPAPIQVHWIGYPNSTGLDGIDYRITDAWVDPPIDGNACSSEQLWRLPGSFLCYKPFDAAPEPQAPPCLARDHVTFGSFNSRAKLSDECIALWCRILDATPSSKLVLKSIFGADDETARSSLRHRFALQGIAAGRVDVLPPTTAQEDHLATYHALDIALDSFPYNGTTTTCEALWMGVPVVTLAGDRHASRVGVSLLNNVGLAELIAQDADDYVRIATELAKDPDRLADLRATMRERMTTSRLMDGRAMGSCLGGALREMWQRHCSRFSPELPVEGFATDEQQSLLSLHIGGKELRAGWKILDAIPRKEVDFIGDIRRLEAFADESCGEVYASHVLEHVGQAEMMDTLNGLYRILAPGGRLYLSVPDLDVLSWLFLNPSMGKLQRFEIMRMMFGGQVDEFDFHKIGLNFDFLMDYLRGTGFARVEHVESFGLFDDTSNMTVFGHPISLNLIAVK